MIRVPTVLILGAGSSMPYDFPSGHKLLTEVCRLIQGNNAYTQALQERGFGPDRVEAFRLALCRSGRASVDQFLEQRTEFIDVGKTAIAAILIPYENDEVLMNPGRTGNWYQYLWSQIGVSWEAFGSNRLKIITYNYDRSLEWYLFNSLKNSFGKSDAECVKKLQEIPIVHVHGELGDLSIPNVNPGRPYNQSLRPDLVANAAKGIRIIHEDIHKYPEFHDAKQYLSDARLICFLGFGFHSLNLQRLEISKLRPNRLIFGTIRGLKGAELTQLSEDIGGGLNTAADAEIVDFLRDQAIFLRKD